MNAKSQLVGTNNGEDFDLFTMPRGVDAEFDELRTILLKTDATKDDRDRAGTLIIKFGLAQNSWPGKVLMANEMIERVITGAVKAGFRQGSPARDSFSAFQRGG